MKITELIKEESDFDSSIKTTLTKKGYKFLGRGVDQHAYLAPDGTVLKIFGTKKSQYKSGSTQLTKQQQSFIVFADYCQRNQNNPFLPKIYGWETFKLDNHIYLQIKMERLAEIGADTSWGDSLEYIADEVYRLYSIGFRDEDEILDKILEDPYALPAHHEVLSHFGEEIMRFMTAVKDLSRLAHKYGFTLDLHGNNYMLNSNGDIVISDPFHAGFRTKRPFNRNIGTAKVALPNDQKNIYRIIRRGNGPVPGAQAEFKTDEEAITWFKTEIKKHVLSRVPESMFWLFNATDEERVNFDTQTH